MSHTSWIIPNVVHCEPLRIPTKKLQMNFRYLSEREIGNDWDIGDMGWISLVRRGLPCPSEAALMWQTGLSVCHNTVLFSWSKAYSRHLPWSANMSHHVSRQGYLVWYKSGSPYHHRYTEMDDLCLCVHAHDLVFTVPPYWLALEAAWPQSHSQPTQYISPHQPWDPASLHNRAQHTIKNVHLPVFSRQPI